jgi:hypothetical protein
LLTNGKLARVLLSLQQCHLQMENLDKIITIVKNWFNYPHTNCMANKNTKDHLKGKALWLITTMS